MSSRHNISQDNTKTRTIGDLFPLQDTDEKRQKKKDKEELANMWSFWIDLIDFPLIFPMEYLFYNCSRCEGMWYKKSLRILSKFRRPQSWEESRGPLTCHKNYRPWLGETGDSVDKGNLLPCLMTWVQSSELKGWKERTSELFIFFPWLLHNTKQINEFKIKANQTRQAARMLSKLPGVFFLKIICPGPCVSLESVA